MEIHQKEPNQKAFSCMCHGELLVVTLTEHEEDNLDSEVDLAMFSHGMGH